MYRVKEGVIGSAIGDAISTSTKGLKREYLLMHPVTKMLPYIKKGIPKGAWSDSTSLLIATMSAISKKDIDYEYIAENCVSWFTGNKYCSCSESFGIGDTTLKALIKYTKRENKAYECGLESENCNGNSALKMMLPLAFYFQAKKVSKEEMFEIIIKVSSITHRHDISICACYIYVNYVLLILNGNNKFAALKQIKSLDYSMFTNNILNNFNRLLIGNIDELEIDEIKSTSYVVDTLESVLWCFIKSDNYKNCILATTNIGDDTSSIGALCGAIAGIYYGTNKIPNIWLDDLRKKELLINISENYETFLRNLIYK